MKRLIEAGLMFGNLVRIDAPALVERYNRGLAQLAKRRTALADFSIDISGFSPEIADEFGDPLYLNPNGCNRQFILLSPEQKEAPLLDAKFSFSREVLRRFITLNEAQVFSLTARDAICGEIENSVFELSSPARLLDIRRLTVVADTTGNHVAEAERLTGLIERFRTEPEGWFDDALVTQITDIVKKTGDVTRHPVRLAPTSVDAPDFWTSHFGGVYIFRSPAEPAAIAMGPRLEGLPIAQSLSVVQRNEIARFLDRNGLVEPVVARRGAQAGALLRQKMDFILVDAAAALGIAGQGGEGAEGAGLESRRELRALAQRLGDRLPAEFQALAALLRWAEAEGPWPAIDSRHPAYFYTLRAAPGPLRDLVNMLLAELAPLDVRQLYICHKELFYALYRTWPEAKRAFVAQVLQKEYLLDKTGTRARLFGAEPAMEEPPAPPVVAGPWGTVAGARP